VSNVDTGGAEPASVTGPDADRGTDSDTTAPTTKAGSPWRARVFLALRVLTVAVVGYFVVATTVDLWPDVRETFGRLSWPVLIISTVFAALSIGASMVGWRSILADLGHPIPLRAAAQINLVGQLGKYVPGSVWAYVLQMQLARRVGVPRSRGFLASLVLTLIGVTAGVTVGALGLRAMAERGDSTSRAVLYVALALLPVALAYCNPWALSRLIGLALRITRRDPLARSLSWRGVLGTFGWAVLGYAFAGVHLWLLAGSVAGTGVKGLVTCASAFALAMIAGTFAFLLPSGLGVREFVIAATLSGAGVPYGQAYALALVSRLLITVADVVAAGSAALVAARRVRDPAS
jgi:uncharacterized membrane protein YbhN (UPF0104 family)